jgi:hypothetical protein
MEIDWFSNEEKENRYRDVKEYLTGEKQFLSQSIA